MSLESLRQLRRERLKPDTVVKVIVGRRHPVLDGEPDVITIAAPDQPQHMDWRAVVGLPVAVFVMDGASDLGEQTYDAIKAAGGKPLGVAWRDIVIGADAAKPTLQKMWSALCRS